MMQRKVALEEHVVLPTLSAPGAVGSPGDAFEPEYFADVRRRLADSSLRLEDMDRFGIETMVLSLSQPGVQGIFDRATAVDTARRLNDELAEVVARHPRRFAGFAALPLQDPAAAGDELGREFWERVAALDVPIYLHPRDPLVTQRRIYEGYPALLSSAWGFGVETATHALRLIMSGLFDRFPGVSVVLGHLAEGLPFLLPRVEHRLRHARQDLRGRQTRPMMSYLRDNFFITTSGAFRTAALLDTLLEVGAERVLFSVDYPFENMQEQTEWFEGVPISEADRHKIGAENARRLLKLD
jgi:2,3-dihydroxybenzoate decarboxylase